MPRDGSDADIFYRALVQLAEIAPATFPDDLLRLRRALLADPELTLTVAEDEYLQDLIMVLYDNRVSAEDLKFIASDSPLTPYIIVALHARIHRTTPARR